MINHRLSVLKVPETVQIKNIMQSQNADFNSKRDVSQESLSRSRRNSHQSMSGGMSSGIKPDAGHKLNIMQFSKFIAQENNKLQKQFRTLVGGHIKIDTFARTKDIRRSRKSKGEKVIAINVKPHHFFNKQINYQPAYDYPAFTKKTQEQPFLRPEKVLTQILSENNQSAKDYLRELYENTPMFDHLPPTYEESDEQTNKWGILANAILTGRTENEGFCKKFSEVLELMDLKTHPDNLVKMCLSRKKKNISNERVPKFPFTFRRILAKYFDMMEKEHQREAEAINDDIQLQKLKQPSIRSSIVTNIQGLLERYLQQETTKKGNQFQSMDEIEQNKNELSKLIMQELSTK